MSVRIKGETPREHDQFFSKDETAAACVAVLKSELVSSLDAFDMVLEPSCGEGAFVRAVTHPNLLYMDIDAADDFIRRDFLMSSGVPQRYFHTSKKRKAGADAGESSDLSKRSTCLTIGNPPFGKNSSKAIDFFNKAALFSDVIAFVLPKTFCKISVQDKLDREFFLVKEAPIADNAFTFKGESTTVPCVFQVWVHHAAVSRVKTPPLIPMGSLRLISPRVTQTADFTFVKVGDAPDLIIRRVGVLAGKIYTTDLHRWTTTNHYFIRVTDRTRVSAVTQQLIDLDLEKLPAKYATAGMPSISISELCAAYNECYKKT